jgi:hypothetical protein
MILVISNSFTPPSCHALKTISVVATSGTRFISLSTLFFCLLPLLPLPMISHTSDKPDRHQSTINYNITSFTVSTFPAIKGRKVGKRITYWCMWFFDLSASALQGLLSTSQSPTLPHPSSCSPWRCTFVLPAPRIPPALHFSTSEQWHYDTMVQ